MEPAGRPAVCFFLFGVELIDSIVEEPFGRDRDDLDLDRYCRTIREGVEGKPAIGFQNLAGL